MPVQPMGSVGATRRALARRHIECSCCCDAGLASFRRFWCSSVWLASMASSALRGQVGVGVRAVPSRARGVGKGATHVLALASVEVMAGEPVGGQAQNKRAV